LVSSIPEFLAATDLPVFQPAGDEWRPWVSRTGVPWVELKWQRDPADGEVRVGAVRQEATWAYKHPDNKLRAEININDTLENEFASALGHPHDERPAFVWSETGMKLDGRNVAFQALVNPADETEWVAFRPHENAWVYARSIGIPMSTVELVKVGA
jgi:hypothetical protein